MIMYERFKTRINALPRLQFSRVWIGIGLLVLAALACSPPAPDAGITCLINQDDMIIAYNHLTDKNEYFSQDGGFTWQRKQFDFVRCSRFSMTIQQKNALRNNAFLWQLEDVHQPQIQYRFLKDGDSIERSVDNGTTWSIDYQLPPGSQVRGVYHEMYERKSAELNHQVIPVDAIIHEPTGNLIVNMGIEGVLIRTPDGNWQNMAVGPYYLLDLDEINFYFLLSGEFWLALAFGLLTLGNLNYPHAATKKLSVLLIFSWGLWLFTNVVFPPAITYAKVKISSVGLANFVNTFVTATIVTAIFVGLFIFGKRLIERQSIKGISFSILLAAGNVILFFTPYFLWYKGKVADYSRSQSIALLLAGFITFAEWKFLRKTSRLALEL